LLNGFNGIEGNKWSVCKFRPSVSPLENFTQALTFDGVLSVENRPNTTDYLSYFESIKTGGADALMTIYSESEIVNKQNLLVVIDQVEDIFYLSDYFNSASSKDDDILFDIVNKTARIRNIPIYFILSIRTGYLSNLSQYNGLQELISKSQYAIQNISLASVNQMIHEGFKSINVQFSNSLIESLHEELLEDTALLPKLQYLLYSLYKHHLDLESDHQVVIQELDNYIPLKEVVSNSFFDYFESLEVADKDKIELLIRAFFNSTNQLNTNYRICINDLIKITGLDMGYIQQIYTTLKEDFQSLIQVIPAICTQIHANNTDFKWKGTDLLQISYTPFYFHPTFQLWVREEATYYWRFKEYANSLKKYKDGEAGLLTSPQLDIAVEWINNRFISASWSSKYNLPFAVVVEFIHQSKEKQEKKAALAAVRELRERKNERIQRRLYISFTIIAVFLMLFAGYKWSDADKSRKAADADKLIAQDLMRENQIISHLVKIKAKAPSMLVQLKNTGNNNSQLEIIKQIRELINTELLFDSLNSIYKTSYVSDDWMHDLNQTALSLLEGKKDYTETSMLIGDLKTYPILDFSLFNNQLVAFIGSDNKLFVLDLKSDDQPQLINHSSLFKGQIKQVLFMDVEHVLLLTDRHELLKLSLITKNIQNIYTASEAVPIIDFIYNKVEDIVVIVEEQKISLYHGDGKQQVYDDLGNHYTASYLNQKLYVATSKGIFQLNKQGEIRKLKLVKDINPTFEGLSILKMKGNYAFIGFDNGRVKMYEFDHEQLLLKHIFSLNEHFGAITSIYYDEMEKVLYSSGVDNKIFRYDLRIDNENVDENFSELKGHESTVWKIDGFENKRGQRILVTADQNGHLLTWYIDDIDMVKDLKKLVDKEFENK